MFYWTLMSTLLASDFFLWWRADKRLRGRRRSLGWRIAVATFVLVQITFMVRILLWAFVPRHNLNIVFVWGFCLAYVWHLLVIPLTLIVMAVSAVVLRRKRAPIAVTNTAATNTAATNTAAASNAPRIGISRRDVLRGAVVAIPPLLAVGGLGVATRELYQFRIRRMVLPLRLLPPQLDGMTIAHVSDTHVGRFTNDRLLDAIAKASNDLQADLMLFAGDLIDVALGDLDPAIRFAKKLRGRYGTYFCEGNHDLIEDGSHDTTVFESTTRAAGLPMLFDEAAMLRVRDYPVQIIGGRWSKTGGERAKKTLELMQLRDPSAFGIFLTHHPHSWDGCTMPLTLSGHTHGGQLMLNERLGVGPIMFRYWSGLYQRGEQSLVVSNGTGNWFPVRTMAPAEIIHITLRCV